MSAPHDSSAVETHTLDFWFDMASSYSYLSAMRINALAAQVGVAIRWRAFLLGPIFQAQGWQDSPFNQQPAKLRYMWRDVERLCTDYAIPFKRPSVLPRNSVLAARVAVHYQNAPWVGAFVQRVFQANFVHDQDIADPAVIAACLRTVGQDPETTLTAAQDPAARPALRAATAEAQRLGLFGAPSFVVGDELFWGDDRLEQALAWARNLPGIT